MEGLQCDAGHIEGSSSLLIIVVFVSLVKNPHLYYV